MTERIEVSVVTPFFNERGVIELAIRTFATSLATLGKSWELLVVNDGSTDGSAEIAARVVAELTPNVRLLGYPQNRGRGFALRTGIAAARGDVIVTTEIDLSWGEHIVHDLVAAISADPKADIVVASPHLPGGGYKNVPWDRVFYSTWGNRVIRTGVSNAVTMNTGMTRAYRREVIQSLPLFENEKEFHLEVILKASSFGFRITEIPALLEWKDYKHADTRVVRKSSSKVNRLIVTHGLFSLFANPVHYVLPASVAVLLLGVVAMGIAVIAWIVGAVSAFMAIFGVGLLTLGIILFVLAVVARQGNMVQHELWSLQRILLGMDPAHRVRIDSSPERSPASE
jgi:glycosyltransferase involved in cell wall biosynthesis